MRDFPWGLEAWRRNGVSCWNQKRIWHKLSVHARAPVPNFSAFFIFSSLVLPVRDLPVKNSLIGRGHCSLSQQLSSWLEVGLCAHCPSPFEILCRSNTHLHSLWVCMCIRPVMSGKFFFPGDIHHLIISPSPHPHRPLSCEGRYMIKTSSLGPRTLMFFTLCILSICGSYPIHHKKMPLWCGLNEVLLCGYNSIPLGVIVLLCCFSRIIELDFFPPRPMTYLVSCS